MGSWGYLMAFKAGGLAFELPISQRRNFPGASTRPCELQWKPRNRGGDFASSHSEPTHNGHLRDGADRSPAGFITLARATCRNPEVRERAGGDALRREQRFPNPNF